MSVPDIRASEAIVPIGPVFGFERDMHPGDRIVEAPSPRSRRRGSLGVAYDEPE
jgi:hypothetical protein